ncbi:MAG: trypsin-like peptidase domain-containing protein [Limisphaerales bacterium]
MLPASGRSALAPRCATLFLAAMLLAAPAMASPPAVIDDEEYASRITDTSALLLREHKLVSMASLRKQVRTKGFALKPVALAHQRLDPPELCDRLRESTLAVGSYYKCPDCGEWHFNGSAGFVVAHGIVCTCCHVIIGEDDGVTESYLVAADVAGHVYPVDSVVAADTGSDACFLKLDTCHLKPLPLRTNARAGERVFCLSHPGGYFFMFTQGMIARLNRRPNEVLDEHGRTNGLMTRPILFLNVTAEFAPGSSGAPVVDEAGNVVGQVASLADAGEPRPADTNAPPSPSVPIRFCTASEEILRLTNAALKDEPPQDDAKPPRKEARPQSGSRLGARHFALPAQARPTADRSRLAPCQGLPAHTRPGPALPKVRIAANGRGFITETGVPFVPMGVTYYRPGTGWAPQVWLQFDPEATRKDFARMKAMGINCARVFVSYHSFYTDPGVLRPEGLAKFDEFLALAEEAGIYVHPTGPDHWEGPPNWQPVAIEDPPTLDALETFWKLFARRYRGRNVIFAYDLKNEPELGWDSGPLKSRWNAWLQEHYGTAEKLAAAWGTADQLHFGGILPPPPKDALKDRKLLDYQAFRETIADEWTRRQAAAIKSVDPEALVTVGLIQWSVPVSLPGSVRCYAAFRPDRQAKFLDFLEIHFYPLVRGAYDYRDPADESANLAYLEALVRETARPGKPVVLAEFGWYGGGKPKFDGGIHPEATEQQQARYCRQVVETSAGFVTGWLNWGFYDHPQAGDCSEFTGLMTVDGRPKAWGKTFQALSARFAGKPMPAPKAGDRPALDWDALVTSTQAAADFRQKYLEAFLAGRGQTAPTQP